MDFLIETILEIVMEGFFLLSSEKKVPMIIRLIVGLITIACYVGFIGMIMYVAINNKSIVLFVVAILVAVIVAYAFWKNYRTKNK